MRKSLIWLIAITLCGFAMKFYPGPGAVWVQNYGAGVMYEAFWVLFIFVLLPRVKNLVAIAAGVFVMTCFLEILQLNHAPFLEKIRGNFFGRTLIGTDFSWLDFPHYFAGCLLGLFLISKLRRESR